MLSTLRLTLSENKGKKYGFQLSSVMQSILMSQTDAVYAEEQHQTGLHPYSQYIRIEEGNKLVWTIHTMQKKAKEALLLPLLSDSFQEIELKDREETLKVEQKNLAECSEDDLIKRYYLGSCSRYLRIRFLTPTSFKTNGQYVLFPSSKLIFQSLMQKFDASSETSEIFSKEMVSQFEDYSQIIDYRLNSTRFYISSARIPSFMGTVTILLKGPQQFANVAWMLAAFGEYSGVGIKAGMGMGGMEIVEQKSAKDTNHG